MNEIFGEISNIINENNKKYKLQGMAIYLLTTEEEPFRIYKLNMASNDRLKQIVKDNIAQVSDDVIFHEYHNCTAPDLTESVSYILDENVPNYTWIKNKVLNDEVHVLHKSHFEEIMDSIKAYAIRVFYKEVVLCEEGIERTEDKEFICFSKLNKGCFFKSEHTAFTFGDDEGDLLKQVNSVFLMFNERLATVDNGHVVFIMHGPSFEQLFKYYEHINVEAEVAMDTIKNQRIISNIDILKERYEKSINVKRKLYKIRTQGNMSNITIEKFKQLKERYGDKLLYSLNDDDTIKILEDKVSKSVLHVLRIYNDELAETVISETTIFANEKVAVE